MTTRRRFTAAFKARVALEALRGDKDDPRDRLASQGACQPGERVETPSGGRFGCDIFQ